MKQSPKINICKVGQPMVNVPVVNLDKLCIDHWLFVMIISSPRYKRETECSNALMLGGIRTLFDCLFN